MKKTRAKRSGFTFTPARLRRLIRIADREGVRAAADWSGLTAAAVYRWRRFINANFRGIPQVRRGPRTGRVSPKPRRARPAPR